MVFFGGEGIVLTRCQPRQPLAYSLTHLKIGRPVHGLTSSSVCFTLRSSSRSPHAPGAHVTWVRASSYHDMLLCQQSNTSRSIVGNHSNPEKTRNYSPLHTSVCEPHKHVLRNPNYIPFSLSWMPKMPAAALTPLKVRARMTGWKLM